MSDFNYKDYLKNNPLINENYPTVSKDNANKTAILDLLKTADGETLLQISDTIGRNTDWVDVDNDTHLRRLTNDIEYDIDQAEGRDIRRLYKDLKFIFPSSLKEDDDWIQKGEESGEIKAGGLHKALGIPEDEKIPVGLINKKLAQLKKKDKDKGEKGVQGLSKADLKLQRQLNLAKSFKKMDESEEIYDSMRGLTLKEYFKRFTK
jgi:hypothetical protein